MCKNIEECTGKQFNNERVDTVIKQCCLVQELISRSLEQIREYTNS